jgi:CheY-like chemotaxis protein
MKELNILLIEDDEIDAMNVKKSLQELNIANQIEHAMDGEEAVEMINENGLAKPMIIFLDLNMPRMNGHEFLEWLRNEAPNKYRSVPVVVLTTSKDAVDIDKAYISMVSGYIVKPVSPESFVKGIATIGNYWLLCEKPSMGTNL